MIYAKVCYLSSEPLWSNIYKFGIQIAQQYTNLHLLVQQ